MKSIKEKSFELFPEMQTDSDDWDVIEAQCDRDDQRKAFVKGANYVLSVLYDAAYKEDWITNPKDGIRRFFEIYRQLKK